MSLYSSGSLLSNPLFVVLEDLCLQQANYPVLPSCLKSHIRLPLLTDQEISSAIKWEAEQYIPIPAAEAIIRDAGNKSDLASERKVNHEDALNASKSYNILEYFECSAKTNENIEILFITLTNEIMKRSNFI